MEFTEKTYRVAIRRAREREAVAWYRWKDHKLGFGMDWVRAYRFRAALERRLSERRLWAITQKATDDIIY